MGERPQSQENDQYGEGNKPSHLPALFAIPRNKLIEWIQNAHLLSENIRMVEGFEVTSSIDGKEMEGREVSLVKISSDKMYPQHIHRNSDARFYIVEGQAIFLSGKKRTQVKPNDVLDIPRGVPHGFELNEGESLTFVSVQSPPIRNLETGEEDLYLTDLV